MGAQESNKTNKGKEAAGKKAAELIESGMIVGLGTGSTVRYFIEALGRKCKEGLQVSAVATSLNSEELGKEFGIHIIPDNEIEFIDITVDGADEIDPEKRMIKGGGGALLREKIVAHASKEMVVIVDNSKTVKSLGGFPLPVEILPFLMNATKTGLEKFGFKGKWRTTENGSLYHTDNGNCIWDIINLNSLGMPPEKAESLIKKIPGVLETGFFFGLAGRVLVGQEDGTVEIRQ